MIAQHTPGEWKWINETNSTKYDKEEMARSIGIYAEDPERGGCWVAVIEGDVFPVEEQEANARLIAAAPELLEACKMLMAIIGPKDDPAWADDDELDAAYDAGVSAVNKATGKERA